MRTIRIFRGFEKSKNGMVAGMLAAVLMGACTPAVDGLVADQGFTHAAIVESELGIVAVVSAETALDATARAAYSDMLRNVILSHRPEFRIASEGAIAPRVDERLRSSIIEAYRAGGELDPAALRALAVSLDPLRYVIFARIDFDEVSHTQNESTRKSGDDKERVFTATTRRTARVTMRIYDLRTTGLAWSASARASKNSTRSNRRPDTGDEEVWISLAGAALGVDEYPAYPQEPALRELLRDAFGDLAQNMPKSES